MILNNFIEYMLMQGLVTNNIQGSSGRGTTLTGGKNTREYFYQLGTHVTSLSAVKSGSGYFYIGLGTNATPVTPDDYAWDNDIADLTHNSWSLTTELKDGRKVMRFTETVTNNTDTDITVSEVGIIVQGNGAANTFLIAREVLDTPITVKANGGAQVFGIDIG